MAASVTWSLRRRLTTSRVAALMTRYNGVMVEYCMTWTHTHILYLLTYNNEMIEWRQTGTKHSLTEVQSVVIVELCDVVSVLHTVRMCLLTARNSLNEPCTALWTATSCAVDCLLSTFSESDSSLRRLQFVTRCRSLRHFLLRVRTARQRSMAMCVCVCASTAKTVQLVSVSL